MFHLMHKKTASLECLFASELAMFIDTKNIVLYDTFCDIYDLYGREEDGVPNKDPDSGVQVFVDLEYDQATCPQTDDWRFTISLRGPPNDYGQNQGHGCGWDPWDSWDAEDGWFGAHQTWDGTWTAEFAITFKKLGITAGAAKTIGIAFFNCWTTTGDHSWPSDADWEDPSTWGTASSSDNWKCPVVGGVMVPIDKFGLLAPYIALVSTVVVATVATAIYVKRRKEK